ncbi:ABC transporter ATP-binding protein/permease [Bradyrhizobium sp. SSBR45G]|uniref:ribosome-associated ATPase/putative transporter RbbA n=1 Tax=unclassified Bradyrhizobium TaxID=2631580 RepID=UPI002342A71F|nr:MULTISPECIES: ribosome-associated ATPase/putative transporter RbbA [unclassified Bradyrhizobium]GLH78131.1 ABC transporter ATP-binding protein/permease [Bradyrhizobium sp. SSBR45G]GLH88029.1 ABC transporter ATP-binding protein/permease [Bradyrhizobium sp. SSBR45R]
MSIAAPPVAVVTRLSHHYRDVTALDDVSIEIPSGCVIGLIGPDGVGKSSLLSILAGARAIQAGEAAVLGADMADRRAREQVCPRIAYMPQGLGKNLYPDLSVRENITFFARLFGQSRAERDWRIAELMAATGLSDFADRPAKKLSGGMKQKLGLCCSLIHDPDFLILDEPTTGVDPLSRRQFWDLIDRLRARSATAMSVIVATAYMEEAERFDWLVAMNDGRILATGTPAELKAQAGAATIEDAFVALLPPAASADQAQMPVKTALDGSQETVIVARDLTCRFGDFTAVDGVNFQIRKGEIFGFVGSNGCGKTTTMKMLTGLLPPSAGEALIFGRSMEAGNRESRGRVGYMSQAFSLYGELTVRQNLVLHARLFNLARDTADKRIAELIDRCDLAEHVDGLAADLPLGIRQRLSLAVAIVHKPDLLILDEPTSGVDPVARNQFWRLLIELSRRDGMTIFVSTHFMNEAARCDRLSLMHEGRVLATDTPDGLIRAKGAQTLEQAFIAFLEREAGVADPPVTLTQARSDPHPRQLPGDGSGHAAFSTRRLLAYTIREGLELIRDPIRLMFALFGTAFLMIVIGFGISTDVNNLTFAALDRDQSPESRAYLAELRGSRYFVEKPPLSDHAELERRMQSGDIKASIEIPPNFGVDIKRGRPAFVSAWIDGAMPFRAETIRGYLEGTHQLYLADPAVKTTRPALAAPVNVEIRFKYNQSFDSIYAMAPSTIALLLALFPAILMALAVVREKELGSITNLYVTPVTRLEFLVGKQLPYIAVAMANFALMFVMALVLFRVPLKGAFPPLLIGSVVYVITTTGFGMLISTFCRTQIAALFGTAILTVLPATQFSGMMVPVSSLSGVARVIGMGFPMTYYRPISVGTFTKGLGFADVGADILVLLVFIPILTGFSLLMLPKQER